MPRYIVRDSEALQPRWIANRFLVIDTEGHTLVSTHLHLLDARKEAHRLNRSGVPERPQKSA